MDSLFLFLLFGTSSKNGKIGGVIFIWSFLLLETEQLSPNSFSTFSSSYTFGSMHRLLKK